MKILWRRNEVIAKYIGGEKEFTITCDVRNELNARRRRHDPKEVVNVVNLNGTWGPAYMPRQFPRGTWKITAVEDVDKSKGEYYPYKIRTDAHQMVTTWKLDAKGGYDSAEDRLVDDGYLLHHSCFKTTLGCGRIATEEQARELAGMIRKALARKEPVELEVI